MEDKYYPPTTYVTSGAIITIHRPILTEEERAKRMKAIEKAAINLALANRRAEALRQQREGEATGRSST